MWSLFIATVFSASATTNWALKLKRTKLPYENYALKADKAPKNVVKLNLFSLPLKNLSFQYERALNQNFSACLGVSYLTPRVLPNIIASGANNASLNFSGFAFTPELRFYTGKNGEYDAPEGFYLAPYFRYANYRVKSFYNYYDLEEERVENYVLTGRYRGTGGGLMLGYQFIINNRISLDWWILGIHGGSGKLSLSMESDFRNDKDAIYNDLTNTYADLGVVSVSVTDTKATVSLPLPYFGVRSGFCFGVAF